ncbi:MAG: hypothetical protein K9W42_00180 [Candidatus Heimdallarchaeota archaeon]|nr:hypothetical protein [Candidatus Heimdallarchaeota archaeon]
MKILHIGNNAANPQTIAKYQRKYGHISDVICRANANVFQAQKVFPDLMIVKKRARVFIRKAVVIARKYEIIHVHSYKEPLYFLKKFYPRKKIILTFRGTDIRGKWDLMEEFWKKADLVTVSTKDLLEGAPEGVVYTPNPVDREHFKRRYPPTKKLALYIHIERFKNSDQALELARTQAEKQKLKLVIWRRDQAWIPYELLPRFLELFEYYIDIKTNHLGEIIPALSTTALQALAMNTKVIFQNKLLEKLPPEHEPEAVYNQLMSLYVSIKKRK